MKNTLIKVFRLQRVDSVADRVFTGNDRTDIMKKWNRPAMHFPACLKWIRSAGLKGYEKARKIRETWEIVMAGKKNRDRTEKTLCRENGKAMEMVIETEAAQGEKQQIPGNEPANADKKKQEEREAELPEAFLKRMRELLGEEFPAFLESYEAERVQGLRWNPLKGEPSSLVLRYGKRFGLSPVSWCAEGNYYDQKTRPGKHALHEAGIYYIQEPSAMAVTVLLDPQPGERILDLCAAPGGKTTHIAGRMRNQGLLVSNEIHPARAKILSRNVERMGIGNCVVTNEDSGRLRLYFPEFFDRIVVDVPCSGEGMFRKDELARSQWSPENVLHCAKRQQEILDNAAAMLKPGGRLVYSTCTFAPEEDEQAVERFLQEHRDFSIEKPECAAALEGLSHGRPEWSQTNMTGLADTFRIWPHKCEGEGHYLACLKKTGDNFGEACQELTEADSRKKEKKKDRGSQNGKKKGSGETARENQALLQVMFQELFTRQEAQTWRESCSTERLVSYGDQIYLLPAGIPDLSGLRVLRPGLHLATGKKNRLEPSHALALFLDPDTVNQSVELDAESAEIRTYLSGGTLSAEGLENGWALVCADGWPAGWAKASSGILKNHYPKGLRQDL